MKFDVRFYLVSILFIIFDLEVAFLFPWAVVFGDIGWYGFWSVMIFLARAHHRLRLRVAEGSARMGLIAEAEPKLVRAGEAVGRAERSRISSRSTTNSPTRASSSPLPTT